MNYSFEDIARYAGDEMTAAERQSFETALAADANLRQQLDLYREVQTGLEQALGRDDRKEDLKTTLTNLGKEHFQQPRAKLVSFKVYIRTAIAAAAVTTAILIWRPWQPGLFNEYAETQMISTTVRGENTDTLLEKAATAFNKEEFETAAGLLQQVVQLQPGNSLARYYYGIALLHTGQATQSRTVLNEVYTGSSVFKYDAAFYIALGYLKEKNKPVCREWLKKIPPGAGSYDKANELLRKL